jgi:hypothetical protein
MENLKEAAFTVLLDSPTNPIDLQRVGRVGRRGQISILSPFATGREPCQRAHDRSRACQPRVLVPESASPAHANSQPQSANRTEGVPVRAVVPEINGNPVPRPRPSQDTCDGSPFVPGTGWPDLQHALAADERRLPVCEPGLEGTQRATPEDCAIRVMYPPVVKGGAPAFILHEGAWYPCGRSVQGLYPAKNFQSGHAPPQPPHRRPGLFERQPMRGNIANAWHVHASLQITQRAPADDDDRHQADQPAEHRSGPGREHRSARAQGDRSERPVKIQEQQELPCRNTGESRP